MTMRRMNKAQQMTELKNEILTTEIFMAPLVRESEALDKLAGERLLTKEEQKRKAELIDLVHEKLVFITKANEQLGAYFAPASA